MTDIVDRLKAIPAGPFIDWSIRELAAAEIIRLRKELQARRDDVSELIAENARFRNQLDAARTGKALLALEEAQAEIERVMGLLGHACKQLVSAEREDDELHDDLISTLEKLGAERALCDQLADHLRGLLADTHERRYTDDGGCGGCYDALAAYEAARKEGAR